MHDNNTFEDRLLDDDGGVQLGLPATPQPRLMPTPPDPQPTNQATMMCLRGPCEFCWQMTVRGDMQGDRIFPVRHRSCIRHQEESELDDQNIFDCSQWWPGWLAWVPVSLRFLLRKPLVALWELQLKLRGWDFSWRTWPRDIFESDRKGERSQGGLGYSKETFRRREAAGLTQAGAHQAEGGLGGRFPKEEDNA